MHSIIKFVEQDLSQQRTMPLRQMPQLDTLYRNLSPKSSVHLPPLELGIPKVEEHPPLIIATLMREYGEAGIQTHVNILQQYLKETGASSHLINPFAASSWLIYPLFGLRKVIDPLSKSASVWWYRYWHYQCLKLALRPIVLQNPPIIYAQCPLSALAALETRLSPQTRVVMKVGFNISQADEFVSKGMLKHGCSYYNHIRSFEEMVLPQLDGIVYVSQFIRDELEERIPKLKNVKSTVLPNFTNLNLQDKINPVADIITIGTLEPRKNHAYLLKILAEAAKRGKRYSLSILGDGPERKHLQNLAISLDIADQVKFFGFRKQAFQYIPGHRLYCHTSTMESFGISLIEAMAAGLPVLAAPVGGIPEIFKDRQEGCYWPLNDVDKAATILINILEDSEFYSQLSQASVKRFELMFSTEQVAKKLSNFLFSS
jgi:glycosyltransferase involved in cell wall biosynthesis